MSVEGDPVAPVAPEEWHRFHAPDGFRKAVAAILVPGSTIVVTADTLDEMGTGAPTAVLEADPGQ